MSYSNSLFLESVVLGELEDPELQGSPLALWAAEYLWAEDREAEAEARLVEAKAAAVVWEAEFLWAALEDREAEDREAEADALAMDLEDLEDSGNW